VTGGAPLPTPNALEVLANLLFGDVDDGEELPSPRGFGPRAALEEAIVPHLEGGPCLVSFSGGRDSSAVLAIATHVARREGLPLPVPATLHFPGVEESHEGEWQSLVLRHLGLRERAVVTIDTELDALGPVATRVLDLHGVLWPGNAYLHAPLFALAPGGSLLTGVGGDELFDTRGARFVLVLARRERPSVAAMLSAGQALAPRALRAEVWRRRHPTPHPWLTEAGGRLVDRALAADAVRWPQRWDAAARRWHRTRAHAAVRDVLPALGADLGVTVSNPFVEPTVLAELVRAGGAAGYPSRTAAMHALVGDLLPPAVLERSTKAAFTTPVFGPETRAFAERWDGSGVDHDLVDPHALRGAWMAPQPNMNTILLLHTAWRHERSGQRSAFRS
jgi:asparagine synthase (glutamine-hydrolysing)